MTRHSTRLVRPVILVGATAALAVLIVALYAPLSARTSVSTSTRLAYSVREYLLPHKNPDAFAHDPAVVQDHHRIGDRFDLVKQVRAEKDGDALALQVRDEVAEEIVK